MDRSSLFFPLPDVSATSSSILGSQSEAVEKTEVLLGESPLKFCEADSEDSPSRCSSLSEGFLDWDPRRLRDVGVGDGDGNPPLELRVRRLYVGVFGVLTIVEKKIC